MKADPHHDRLYLFCLDCKTKAAIARVFPYSSTSIYEGTDAIIAYHATCNHQFGYEADLPQFDALSWEKPSQYAET